MKLIVLRGKKFAGKTKTLTVLYRLLKYVYAAEPFNYTDLGGEHNDFRVTLLIDPHKICHQFAVSKVKVGIITQGDYVRTEHAVDKLLQAMLEDGCDVTICACSCKTRQKKKPIDSIKDFLHNQGIDKDIEISCQDSLRDKVIEILSALVNML
ncbi:MAG: hypothetical protein J6T96_10805 [Bacteroidales bacterium]|nr:hypothetical protein [Bacteroidales bacterium]